MKLLQALVLGIAFQVNATASALASDAEDYINPDRPGIADGSNVAGAGRFQIETGIQQEYRNRDGNKSRTVFLPTLLRIGINQRFELRVESNVDTWMKSFNASAGTIHTEGAAPASVGIKYHFVDAIEDKLPSIGAILRFFPRSGARNFKTTHATGDFRLVADWDFSPQWSLNPNVGVGIYEDDTQHVYAAGLFATTLSYNPSKKLSFFIDTGLQSPETKHGKTAVAVDLGATYIAGQNVQLDFSIGSGVEGTTSPRLFWSAGISKRF